MAWCPSWAAYFYVFFWFLSTFCLLFPLSLGFCFCKTSGMWTMATHHQWCTHIINPMDLMVRWWSQDPWSVVSAWVLSNVPLGLGEFAVSTSLILRPVFVMFIRGTNIANPACFVFFGVGFSCDFYSCLREEESTATTNLELLVQKRRTY